MKEYQSNINVNKSVYWLGLKPTQAIVILIVLLILMMINIIIALIAVGIFLRFGMFINKKNQDGDPDYLKAMIQYNKITKDFEDTNACIETLDKTN